MVEELKLAREAYICEARGNIAKEAYYINKSVALGFEPHVLVPAMLELPLLTSDNYQPKLDCVSSDERFCWLFFISGILNHFMRIRTQGLKYMRICMQGPGHDFFRNYVVLT
jgi:hypothetical protein